jgi:hypothetical protein
MITQRYVLLFIYQAFSSEEIQCASSSMRKYFTCLGVLSLIHLTDLCGINT